MKILASLYLFYFILFLFGKGAYLDSCLIRKAQSKASSNAKA